MQNLIIIGARGWGREVLWSLREFEKRGDFIIKGFLDDKSDALDGLVGEFPPILGTVEKYEIQDDDIFFCALGDPSWRKHYAEIIENKGGHFYTYISPLAIVSKNAIIGEGSFVGAYSTISDNVNLGKQVIVQSLSILGHDVKIGHYVSIEAYSFFGGYAEVGDMSTIHVRASVLRHKKVGRDASVGASSVVIRNVKDGTHVYGSPAVRIDG